MEEQLINFETAKLAKEKGFELDKYLSINDENPKNLNSNYNPRDYQPWYFDLTQSLLQKWLREKYQIDIIILPKEKDKGKFYGGYIDSESKHQSIGAQFSTYEEALEIGLQESLKLIK